MKKYILGLMMISMLAACSSQETDTTNCDSTCADSLKCDSTTVVLDSAKVDSVKTVETAK